MLLPDLKRVRLLDFGRMGTDDNKNDGFAQCDAVALFAVSMLTLMLSAWPALAQDAEDDGNTDPAPNLELFDDDVERTREGWPQLYVSAGFMTLDADGIFSVRPPLGNDVKIIDFDRVGLNESDSSYWLTIQWRSSNSRWGAWFGSWQYDVIGSRIWQNSLVLPDGGEIPVGASVTSDFNARWFILEATYSFYRSKSFDAGIGFGIHSVDLDTSLTARVQIGGQETEVISGNLGTLAPLPNVLTYASWKVSPKWMLIARVGFFTLDYDKFDGDMLNAHGTVSYSLSQRWSLGVGYQFVYLDLVIDQSNYVEIYDLDFEGPMAYARFRF